MEVQRGLLCRVVSGLGCLCWCGEVRRAALVLVGFCAARALGTVGLLRSGEMRRNIFVLVRVGDVRGGCMSLWANCDEGAGACGAFMRGSELDIYLGFGSTKALCVGARALRCDNGSYVGAALNPCHGNMRLFLPKMLPLARKTKQR